MESIRINGFNKQQKIQLYKTLLLINPDYGKKIVRKIYIGDGCHRLACLIWLEKNILLSKEYFAKKLKIVYKPVNSFGIFKILKIFDSNEMNYKEFKIKVFEIDYKIYHELNG
mgnify:CR=1 FL=1